MRFAHRVRFYGLLLFVGSIGLGCTGEVTTIRDALGNKWNVGEFTYQQLVETTQEAIENDTEDDTLPTMKPDQLFTSMTFKTRLGIHTVSKPHVGDLEFVARALRKKRGDFIVTLEVPNGPLLTSRSLAGHGLVRRKQLQQPDRVLDTEAGLDIEVPGDLAAPDSRFPVALLACIDSNYNGRCTDELVDVMEDLQPDAQSNVVFFRALEAIVHGLGDDRTMQFQQIGVDQIGSPEWIMTEVLRNLPSAAGQLPLSVALAVGAGWANEVPEHTFQATGTILTPDELGTVQAEADNQQQQQKKKRKKRTNGCFVKGTRIILGNGAVVLVEDVFEGTLVSTASGLSRRAKRAVAGPERFETVAIQTEGNRRIEVTRTHPMMTPSGLQTAERLQLGDLLVAADGSVVKITSLRRRRLAQGDLVYNFALPGTAERDHLVNAEGLVTGDLHLQQQLSR